MTSQKLLIDKDCPMCRTYARCFVKLNRLAKESIAPYQTIHEEDIKAINMERAKKEIALVNTSTGEVTYGLDSLIKIVTTENSIWNRILKSAIVHKPLNGLYHFISNNRTVIAVVKSAQGERECDPPVNIWYRWIYILGVALITGLIVNNFTSHLFPALGWTHTWHLEYFTCFGQVLWQSAAINLVDKNKALNYLGNMSTVSMIGALILLPFILVLNLITAPTIVIAGYFFMVVGIMFLEHIRRCKILGLTLWMTFSWVLFRHIALFLILKTINVL